MTVCPRIEPLSAEFRAELDAAQETAPPVIRMAMAEWGALRDQARACQDHGAQIARNRP